MPAPTLAALVPSTAVMGGPPFPLRVLGEGFDVGAVIVWNGGDEPTTYVSPNELQTQVQPATASGHLAVLIAVRNPDAAMSQTLAFTFYEHGYCPVTAEEVATVLGPNQPVDQRLRDATAASCELVYGFLDPPLIDPLTGAVWTWPSPLPASWHEAIVGLALDLYRAPTYAFGYFTNDLGIAPTGPDFLRRWRQHVTNQKLGYGFA